MTSKLEETIDILDKLFHMDNDKETVKRDVDRILRLLYMSECDELQGASDVRSFKFLNCEVKVIYGNN